MVTGGEDAYCVNKKLLSIADGVGGWSELGIDPSLFSKELCFLIEQLFINNFHRYSKLPNQLLIDSLEKNNFIGTSTSLILILDEKIPRIFVSSIGDSSYLIVRPIKMKYNITLQYIFQSKEQCKKFNLPYQVGTGGDDPRTQAIKYSHMVKNNDIIICGSDGLFDNLDYEQICASVIPFINKEDFKIVDFDLVSEFLANFAFEMSLDKNYESPFYKKSHNRAEFIGGKEDDITVIVAQIKLNK